MTKTVDLPQGENQVTRTYKALVKDIRAGLPLTPQEWHRINYDDMPSRLQLRVQELMRREYPQLLSRKEIFDAIFNDFLINKRVDAKKAKTTLRAIRRSLNRLLQVTQPHSDDTLWVLHHIEVACSNGWWTFYREKDMRYSEFLKLNKYIVQTKAQGFMNSTGSLSSWYGYEFTESDSRLFSEAIRRGRTDDLYLAHKLMRKLPDGRIAPWGDSIPSDVLQSSELSQSIFEKEDEILDYVKRFMPSEYMLNEQLLSSPNYVDCLYSSRALNG